MTAAEVIWTHCEVHGDYAAEVYYDLDVIEAMLEEQGFIDCPECLRMICDE